MKVSRALYAVTFLLWLSRAQSNEGEDRTLPANWAGNVRFAAEEYLFPESEAELQDIVRSAKGQVKVVSTGYS